jgi:outer membrane lipopolysaccharide assembly protein LptE/RlpB
MNHTHFSKRWRSALQPASLTLIFCAALTGCGYQSSGNYDKPTQATYQWHSLYREDLQTVAIPIFGSRDFRRGYEFALSKAVVNQLEAHSPYKVVSREHADTVLEGEIIRAELNTLSHAYREGIPQEQMMTLTVNFIWKDLRTGRILLERKNFQQSAAFYPTLGEGEFVGSQQAVERLALGIVQEMQADW